MLFVCYRDIIVKKKNRLFLKSVSCVIKYYLFFFRVPHLLKVRVVSTLVVKYTACRLHASCKTHRVSFTRQL